MTPKKTISLDPRIARRIYVEQRRHVLSVWWCSFATTEKFLGVALVEAIGDRDARRKCRALRIDPGGEMLAMPVHEDEPKPPTKYMNRLFSMAELESPELKELFDACRAHDLSDEQIEVNEDVVTYVQDQSS